MRNRLILTFLWVTSALSVSAQPFDTLLSPFNTIREIYPLQDSSFILIGSDQSIRVERIDYRAGVIWSLPVVSTTRDHLFDFKFDLNSTDSVLQVATADKFCDAYANRFFKAFTLNLSGQLLDSQTVSFGIENENIFLLSGIAGRPRLAFIEGKEIVVMQADGDTLHLHLTWTNGDTTNSKYLGIPLFVTMCPGGDILVETNMASVFYFRLVNDKYRVVDQSFSGGLGSVLCLEDQKFMQVNSHYLELWGFHTPLTSFDLKDGYIWKTTWRDPFLAVHASFYPHPDSVIFLTANLDLVYQTANDSPPYSTMAIQSGITYKVGSGNNYFDHGLLVSENQTTHEGPKYYDLELVNFEIGPYDDVQFHYGLGGYYLYEIPHAVVTLKNNCAYTLDNTVIHYAGQPLSFCSESSWEKELTQMDLQPNETKTFELNDIFITKSYPEYPSEKSCVYATQPDHHFDDHYEDNELCKKLDLLPSEKVNLDFPIHHTPGIIRDHISFLSPEPIEFDLTIYSYSGIPVFAGHANTYAGQNLNLDFLRAGLYILQYSIPEGDKTYVEKMLKL